MAVEPDRGREGRADRVPADEDALTAVAAWTALAAGAERAVVRILDPASGRLVALRVWARSPALAAEIAGSHVQLAEIDSERQTDAGDHLVRRPALRGELPVASLEIARSGPQFSPQDVALVEVAASLLPLVLGDGDESPAGEARIAMLQLAGEALEAGSRPTETMGLVVRLAAAATGAKAALLWSSDDARLHLEAVHGLASAPHPAFEAAARRALDSPGPVSIDRRVKTDDSRVAVATVRLGEPARGALQLVLPAGSGPRPEELSHLASFGVRAAHALRAAEAAAESAEELERTRALVGVIGEAAARLSLSHTLETATERIAELLGTDRLAVYLGRGRQLHAVAQQGVEGPHVRIGAELLELALGPYRGRHSLWIPDTGAEPQLAHVRHLLREAGIGAALAVPLAGAEQLVGLLAVYPRADETVLEGQAALVSSLAPQLAVAVENARLHEELVVAGRQREEALALERRAARQLRALYEISGSFTESLSLDETLSAVTRTMVDELGVDAAALRMLDARREQLETRSLCVAHEHMEESIRTILSLPQPAGIAPIRRLLRPGEREPLRLDPGTAADLPGLEPLVPFLEKGSTAVIVPVATPGEAVATTTLVSFDPARPIDDETVEIALSIAAQAALAIDNARLYQQQKGLADTMQRALLAHSEPKLQGFEIGAVYESSARVDVGGDIYDFAELPDGRMAVVLGDVAGHGIEAAADMAMAKYVFRSLSREHPDPHEFLAAANQVVAGELAPGKFVTMLYLTIDPASGRIRCASAGHPGPRVLEDGTVRELSVRGLPLGVEDETDYEEAELVPQEGSVLLLHTDGVVESRRGRELYGTGRLDESLRSRGDLPARELARAILASSRAFAGGELPDDCAVVVIRRG
jgi:serine phosphatase RsbU (regulator of sigma subunit)